MPKETTPSVAEQADDRFLPKLPEVGYLGDDVSYGYDSIDMRDYALEAVRACLAASQAASHSAPEPVAGKRLAWDVTQAEQNAMSADQWDAWKAALKAESEPACPHCGKPLINCKCWGEIVAARALASAVRGFLDADDYRTCLALSMALAGYDATPPAPLGAESKACVTAEFSPPSECDSPKICSANRACCGQYDTKKTCAAPAAAVPESPADTEPAVTDNDSDDFNAGYKMGVRDGVVLADSAVKTDAARDVLAEREKQRRKWGDDHDDGHGSDLLSGEAVGFILPGQRPYELAWAYKSKVTDRDPRRVQLVKGVALALAAIECLDRTSFNAPGAQR